MPGARAGIRAAGQWALEVYCAPQTLPSSLRACQKAAACSGEKGCRKGVQMAYLTTHMRGPAERCLARTPRELTFWAVIEGRRLARKLAPSPHRSREARPTPPSSSRHPSVAPYNSMHACTQQQHRSRITNQNQTIYNLNLDNRDKQRTEKVWQRSHGAPTEPEGVCPVCAAAEEVE